VSKVYGLMGKSLNHSLSPKIHEKIFLKTGFTGKYNLFEVKREYLKDAVLGLKALGIKGANVTVPYKIDVIKYLDEIFPEAEQIGAVNTVAIKGDKAMGYNTDYYGFGMTLNKHHIKLKNKTAVILGTGGASRAVSQYLLNHAIGEIIFVSSNIEKARKRYEGFVVLSYGDLHRINEGDILINCTPVGMFPYIVNSPIHKVHLENFKAVIDLIYNPKQTILLKNAKEMGITAINGLHMLIGQAVKAQELWNEVMIDKSIIDLVYSEIDKEIGP